jgi:hypothetical protein
MLRRDARGGELRGKKKGNWANEDGGFATLFLLILVSNF